MNEGGGFWKWREMGGEEEEEEEEEEGRTCRGYVIIVV